MARLYTLGYQRSPQTDDDDMFVRGPSTKADFRLRSWTPLQFFFGH